MDYAHRQIDHQISYLSAFLQGQSIFQALWTILRSSFADKLEYLLAMLHHRL